MWCLEHVLSEALDSELSVTWAGDTEVGRGRALASFLDSNWEGGTVVQNQSHGPAAGHPWSLGKKVTVPGQGQVSCRLNVEAS
jgi:hypothetical protein